MLVDRSTLTRSSLVTRAVPPEPAPARGVVRRDADRNVSVFRLRNGTEVELGASFGGSDGLFPPGYLRTLRTATTT